MPSVESTLGLVRDFVGVIVLAVIYSYLYKLEKTGCACAAHPYANFIRGFTLFAILFILATAFLPVDAVVKAFGPVGGMVYMGVNMLFVVATIVYLAMVIMYARYLMVSKCACSEDLRREVMMIYAVIEILVLAMLVVLPRVLEVLSGAFSLSGESKTVRDALRDPFKSAKKIPKSFKKSFK